jgi:hypothetical protein
MLAVEGQQKDREEPEDQYRAQHDLHRHGQPAPAAPGRLSVMIR